jgi:hypothetical protein
VKAFGSVANPEEATLVDEWHRGLSRFPSFFLTGMSRIREGSGVWPFIVSLVLLAFWTLGLPWGIAWAAGASGWETLDPSAAAGLRFTSIGAFLVIACSGYGWAMLVGRTRWAQGMFSDRLERDYIRWLRRIYRFQWTSWLLAALMAALIWWLLPESRPYFPQSIAAWISLLQFAVASCAVVYMIVALPSSVTKAVKAPVEDLHLFALDPASTPAMRVITEIVTGSSLLILTILMIETIAWVAVRSIPAQTSLDLNIAIAVGYGLGILALIRTSLRPTIQIHWWIVGLKTETLTRLNSEIDQLNERAHLIRRSRERISAERATKVEEFFFIAATENLPFKSATIVQFSTAVFGSAVAFVLGWVFGIPGP